MKKDEMVLEGPVQVGKTDPRPILRLAMQELASVCDGAYKIDHVGFSKADAYYGRVLADSAVESWTPETTWIAYETARVYKSQLLGHGIDFDQITPVSQPGTFKGGHWHELRSDLYARHKKAEKEAQEKADAEARWAKEHRVTFDARDDLFVFHYPYDDSINADVRNITGRRFDGLRRCWVTPAGPAQAVAALALIAKWNFSVEEPTRAMLEVRAAKAAPEADKPAREAGYIEEKQVVVFRYEYNPEINAAIKTAATGARFDGANKWWTAPINAMTYEPLTKLIAKYGFVVHGKLQKVLDRIQADQTRLGKLEVAPVAKLNKELFPFQVEGVKFALRHRKTINGDDMGLGKTAQAIALVATVKLKTLVICPATLKYNWKNEFAMWTGDRFSVEVLNGKSGEYEADVVIVNYDILTKHMDGLRKAGFKVVIMDEAHYIKEPSAQRSKAAHELAKNADYTMLLTGTPVLNRPKELVHPLDTIGRIALFGGKWAFLNRYCDPEVTRFGTKFDGASNTQELHAKLTTGGIMVRRRKEEVLKELPPLMYTTIPVDVTNRAEIAEAERDLVSFAAEQAVQDSSFLASIAGLDEKGQKAVIQARYADKAFKAQRAQVLVRFTALRQLVARGKMEAALTWIADFLESGRKLVIFAHHKAVQDEVLEALAQYNPVHILGGEKAEDVEASKAKFQSDPGCQVIVCSILAAGVGHTLTAASDVCFLELPWRPADVDQAASRCHRIGQKDTVNGWFLLAHDTMDEEMGEVLDAKRKVIDTIVDGSQELAEDKVIAEVLRRLTEKYSN